MSVQRADHTALPRSNNVWQCCGSLDRPPTHLTTGTGTCTRPQIKVLYTHDLLTSPGATLRAVEDFLGAPRARLDPNDKLDTLVYTRDCYVSSANGVTAVHVW